MAAGSPQARIPKALWEAVTQLKQLYTTDQQGALKIVAKLLGLIKQQKETHHGK